MIAGHAAKAITKEMTDSPISKPDIFLVTFSTRLDFFLPHTKTSRSNSSFSFLSP